MRTSYAAIIVLLASLSFTSVGQELSEVYLGRKDGLSSNNVNCILQDNRGLLWIGTDTALDLYDGQTIQSFPTPALSLAHSGDKIWVGTQQGLYVFESSSGSYSQFTGTTRYGVNIIRQVDALAVIGEGRIWAGTRGQGLFIYNPLTGELTQQSIHTPYVSRIEEEASGCVTVESRSGHLDLYSADGVFLRHLEGSMPAQNPSITDSEGTQWIPSPGNGLRIITREQPGIRTIHLPEGASSSHGIALSEDSHGNIWAGAGAKLYRIPFGKDNPDSKAVRFAGEISSLLSSDESVWIGTVASGIYRYRPGTGTSSHYPLTGEVKELCQLSDGTVMAGTSAGLLRYNPKQDGFEPDLNRRDITIVLDGEKSAGDGLVEFEVAYKSPVTALTQDLAEHLYMSTADRGIFRKNLVTRGWEHLVSSKGDSDALPGNKVTTLITAKDGSVWAGTDRAGLWRLNGDRPEFSRVNLPDRLADGASISSLSSDGAGRLWISCSNGIYCYDPKQETITPYNVNPGQLLYTSGGKLLVGQKDALVSLSPGTSLSATQVKPVIIRNVAAGDSLFYIPPGGRRIELPYTNSSFTIRLASPGHSGAGRYSWRLEGYDRGWIDAGSLSTASYTRIPPGKYRFEVEGSEDVLDIAILPPWWRTLPAIILWILMSAATLAGVVYYLFRSVRKRYAKIMKEQEEAREKELYRQRIRFFIGLVHEIRTPLTLIRLQHEKESPGADDVISRNLDYMQGTIDRILTYDKNTSDGVEMLLTRVDLAALSGDVLNSFRSGAKARNINVELSAPQSPVYVNADVDLLHKILNNLLSNALKYAKKQIVIKLGAIADEATLAVEDDGPGVRKEERDKIFEMFYTDPKDTVAQASGMGVGLAYSMQLAKAQGGTITVGDSGMGGAAFTLHLPLIKEAVAQAPVTASEDTQSGITVLIAEDNPELLETLRQDLSPYYKVLTSQDGKQAWEKLEDNAVDVVVSDVMMPVMNGLELCRRIKADASFSHIPVILLTAKVALPDKTEGMESGADAYVEKPFSIRQLKGQIDNLIRLREAFRKAVVEGRSLPETTIQSPEASFMKSIDTAIEKHIDEESFSIEALASDMAMSRTNFFRKFKALTGGTPNEYLKNYRLNRAAQLLRNGARINEAAFQVGFTSSSYFAKCFKARFGVLPKDYLKQ